MELIKEIGFYNIKEEYIIINFLNGATDIINQDIKDNLENNRLTNLDKEVLEALINRKYVFENKLEYKKFVSSINNKIIKDEKNQIPNFLIIPSYKCNFDCPYCYQMTYEKNILFEHGFCEKDIIQEIFNMIKLLISKLEEENKIVYAKETIDITLMGGEPLLSENNSIIEQVVKNIEDNGYSLSVVTNGYNLDKYINLLKRVKVNHVQITIDGVKETHDKRRILKGGFGTYSKIMDNIKVALDDKIPISVRINADSQNIEELPEVANEYTKIKEIYKNLFNPYIYIMSDGGCSGNKLIIDEKKSIHKIYELEKKYPQINIFRKTFHALSLLNTVKSDIPLKVKGSNCAAMNNQYIFDIYGKIYKCWFGIGNKNFEVGEFLPKVNFDYKIIDKWRNRNIYKLEKCKECKFRYICGGGCVTRVEKGFENNVEKERCIDFNAIIEEYLEEILDEV